MQSPTHSLPALFDQLGLASGPADIQAFVSTHSPIEQGLALSEAPFWSKSQADFLRKTIYEDADWAEVVDQLNLMLRG